MIDGTEEIIQKPERDDYFTPVQRNPRALQIMVDFLRSLMQETGAEAKDIIVLTPYRSNLALMKQIRTIALVYTLNTKTKYNLH